MLPSVNVSVTGSGAASGYSANSTDTPRSQVTTDIGVSEPHDVEQAESNKSRPRRERKQPTRFGESYH